MFTIGQGSSTPGTGTTLDDNITAMTEVWNYSANTTAGTWMSAATSPVTRFIAYNDGKLYVLNSSAWNTTPAIHIVDAYTGVDTGTDVNLEGVVTSGVWASLSSIRFVDGTLVASSASNANQTFRVYAWKNGVSSAPTIIVKDTTHEGLVMGANISISGNLTNGRIWANDAGCNNVLYYTITNGTVSQTPTKIALTDADGAALSLVGAMGASEVIPNADGTFWVDGQSAYPILFNASGKQIGTMQAGVFNNNTRGTALKMFTFGTKKYAAAVAYSGTSQTNGYFTLTDITAGEQAATEFICKYPEAGLGSTANDQHMSSICQSTRENGTILDIWVCCAKQGVAHYTYNGAKESETPVLTPEIDATPTTLTMNAAVGETATSVIEVNGSNLAGDITLSLSGTNASMFSISASTIAKATAKGNITVTYTPSAEGDHSATLTIKSTNAKDVTVSLSGYAHNNTSADTGFNDNITKLDEMWIYSTNKGNTASAPWLNVTLTEDFTRDIAVNGENLYVLNCKQWGTPVITILNAFTGASKGTLSVEGISDGRAALGAIDMLGDKLIGVNAVTDHELVFYKWDSKTAAPTKWATTTPGIAMGDQMSVTGNMTNGAIWLINTGTDKSDNEDGTTNAAVPAKVYKYSVTNGVVNTTPTIISLGEPIGSQNGCAGITIAADGSLWVDGKNTSPMHFNTDGTFIEELPADVLGTGNSAGANAIEAISFGSQRYLATTTYVNAAETLSNGAIALVSVNAGAETASQVGIYPSNGFGTTRNVQFINALTHSLTDNNTTLNLWGIVAGQGIAYYRYVGNTPSGVENIEATDNAIYPVEWYNLHGIRVNGDNLVPGIYIRRQGNEVQKIMIR